MSMIKRILVPVDFSAGAAKALEYGIELAKMFGAEVIVLNVIEPIYYSAPDPTGGAATMAELFETQRRQAREEMARLERRYARSGVTLRGVLQAGAPHRAIADAAQQVKADLIVMGTHGRTGVSHLLMGSVAERVVRTAPCPVLTINPSKQRRRPASRQVKRGAPSRRAGGRTTSAKRR